MHTKISVVIPTYKRQNLLINCLRSLRKQTLDRNLYEIIVVSDGNDNETAKALKPWLRSSLNISYLSTAIKKGPAAARNLGWLSARSPLIAFTDDDCQPAPNWLKSLLEQTQDRELIAITGTTIVPLPENPTDFAMNTAGLEQAEFITANCACTKAALLATGGFDERFKLAWREDSELHFKLLAHQIPIVKCSDAIVVHPVRDAPWGISIKEQRKSVFEALLFSKYPGLYRKKIGIASVWHYYLINLLWLVLLISTIKGQYPMAKIAAGLLFVLFLAFTVKRLRKTNKSLQHILEMLSTSIVIPTLSIYWRLYGAIKYRVLFI
jgi:glycosyltransferase involved in cell wall biosynthesis